MEQKNLIDEFGVDDFVDEIDGFEEDERDNRKIYPINSDEISSSVTTYDVFNLASQIRRGKIEIQPIYQRTYVWDNKKAESFIDSLWNNLPIPPLFFLVKKNGNFMVIDGQQRLTSLLRFFLSNEDIEEYLPTLKNTIIGGSKKLSVSGRVFKMNQTSVQFEDLSDDVKRNFENKEMNLVIIKPNYSAINDEEKVDEIIKEIFYRLNTGGVKLSDQEVRQSLYTGYFMQQLKEYSFGENWSRLFPKIKKFTENPSLLTESLLRGFAFLDIYAKKSNDTIGINLAYSKPLGDFLDKYAKITEKLSNESVDERFILVDKVVSLLLKIDDPSGIFQHKKGVTNPKNEKNTLNKTPNIKYIDTLFVGLLNLFRDLEDLKIETLQNIINDFKEDKEIIDHIVRGGSSDEKYVKERVEKSISLVKDLYEKFNQ